MAYTPSTLTIDTWASPIAVVGTDFITELDETFNSIVTGDTDSLVNFTNTELAKLPSYLTTELNAMYAAFVSTEGEWVGYTGSTAELNILDGATLTTAELNILDGVTATATEINTLDGITSTVEELNILDGVTATATDLNKTVDIASGTYTPVASNLTNLSSTASASALYTRIGDIVTVQGYIKVYPIATGEVILHMTLPVAPTTAFNAYSDAAGIVSVVDDEAAGRVSAVTAASTVILKYFATSHTTDMATTYSFSYNVDV